MHESSAEYVPSRGELKNLPPRGPPTTIIDNIRARVGEKKWQVVIGSFLLVTVAAVAIPAGVGHTFRASSHHSSGVHNAVSEKEQSAVAVSRNPEVARAPVVEEQHERPSKTMEAAHQPPPKAHKRKKVQRPVPEASSSGESAEDKDKKSPPLDVAGSSSDAPTEAHLDASVQVDKRAPRPAQHKQEAEKKSDNIFRFTAMPRAPTGDHYVQELRLPTAVRPLQYKLRFEPVFSEQSMYFNGHVRITIECVVTTKMIQMHSSNLAIERYNVSVVPISGNLGPDILNIRTNDFSQFLYINLATDLVAGEKYYINIPFKSVAFYDNGFNVRHFVRENSSAWVIGTNFLPTEARRAFPCFDEPGLKATFNIEILRDRDIHALSNMPLATVYQKKNDKESDIFMLTFPMSTFSVGFFISDFTSYGNSSFRIWTRPGITKDVDFLLRVGPDILKFYENYFSVPYQLPKIDVIAMEHYINDIQNMGLLYLPETIAFFDPDDTSVAKQQTVILTLCHAFSHEWFGNLISPEWWDDVWIMDGFATYFQYRCLQHLERSPRSYDLMIVNDVISVMRHDTLKFSPAIVMNVDTQYRIYQAFNVFSTQKAVAVLRMLDLAMGEDTFKRGIHKVLAERMFQTVTSKFIWDAFTQSQPRKKPLDVRKIMEPWVKQPGFPVLSVTRIYDENAATLLQSKFAIEPEERESRSLWPIPITYVTSEDRSFHKTRPLLWLYEKEGQLESLPNPHHWILVNNRFSGYFKINYDEKNWELVIRQLLWNHSYIDHLNRAQIQNDLFDLAKAGMVNYTLALEATKYLVREQDYIPWKAAFDKMRDVGTRLHTTESYTKWKGYMSSLLSASYENISWAGNATSYLTKDLESELVSLSCYYEYRPCVDKAMEVFKQVQENSEAAEDLPSHLRYTVFCEAVRHGGDANWRFLWDRLQDSDNAAERSDIVKALSCSRNSLVLGNYVKSVMNPNSAIRHEDVQPLLSSVSNNHNGKAVAFKFLRAQWRSIHKRYHQTPEVLFHIEESFIESASQSKDIEALGSFYKHNKKSTMIPEWRYKQVQEERKLEDTWKTRYYPVIRYWLDKISLS